MNTTNPVSIKPFLLTAVAAVFCTAMQFGGIDALASPRSAEATVLRLPTVVVTAPREAVVAAATVQQLPQVVIVTRRLDRTPGTAQALGAAAGSAT